MLQETFINHNIIYHIRSRYLRAADALERISLS